MPTAEYNARNWQELDCPAHLTEITYWLKSLPRFGLRCRRDRGTRTWVVLDCNDSRRPIGDARAVNFAEALKAARRLLSKIRLGDDPAAEKRQRKNAITIRELIHLYLVYQQPRLKPRSFEEVRRHLETHAVPLHNKHVNEVAQRNIVELLQALAGQAPVTANRVRASISAMFAWGMKAGLVQANPVAATFKPSEERARERVLSDGELACIWSCTEDGSDYSRIVRILLVTGARREEIAGMRDGELTWHADGFVTWRLPGERSKNHLPNELVLPPMIAALLPARRENGARELLFGEGEGPFSGWVKCKRRLEARLATAGYAMPHWVLHDLRRTFVTRQNDLGVEPHVIEALVNHSTGAAKAGIAGVYNRSQYSAQKRAALALWCDHIARITGIARTDEGTNVVPLGVADAA
jgi:integrase